LTILRCIEFLAHAKLPLIAEIAACRFDLRDNRTLAPNARSGIGFATGPRRSGN
jgi:hypothetical protein